MPLATLRIASNERASPRDIPLVSTIGNDQQTAECDEGYVGDPVTVDTGTHTAHTLAAANAAALAAAEAALECELDIFPPEVSGGTGQVLAVAIDSSDRAYLGGNFEAVNGNGAFDFLAQITRGGSLNLAFNPIVNDTVRGIRVLSGNRVLFWGDFDSVNGDTNRVSIAIVDTTGVLTAFTAQITGITITTAHEMQDGRIMVGFGSTSGAVINGVAWNHAFAVLSATGVHDTGINPEPSAGVYDMLIRSDGRVVLAGLFTTIAGGTRRGVAILNTDFTLYSTFNADIRSVSGSSTDVYRLLESIDGTLILVGAFNRIHNGVSNQDRYGMAKVNLDTGLLTASFGDPGFKFGIMTDAVELSTGKILGTGNISQVGGVTINYIGMVNADGTRDTAWPDLAPSPPHTEWDVAVFSDNHILIEVPVNETIGGELRSGIALLTPEGLVVPNA